MLRRISQSPWLYFGLAALLLVGFLATHVEIRVPSRPVGSVEDIPKIAQRDDVNLLFIMVDTLRADHLGAYGYERPTSPVLDDLARSGIRFENVRAQSTWTKSSMASLLLATYPASTGVQRSGDAIPEEALLPAEILKEAGFVTAGLFRNGWVDSNFGFGQGFDAYYVPTPSRRPDSFQRQSPSASALQGTDGDATHAAVEFLRSHRDDRFYLYIHYMDVHQYLYEEKSALFGTDYQGAYDNAIHWTDRNIGTLLAELDRQDRLDDTIVAITSDHGEAFYEHGDEGHARNLYQPTTQVPLILGLPFRLEEPIVVEPRVSNVDIWPTLLDLLGLPSLPDADGRSLVPLVTAAARGEEVDGKAPERVFSQLDTNWGKIEEEPDFLVGVTEGDRRLILRSRHPDSAELYDLSEDAYEQNDLADANPEEVEALRRHLDAYLKRKPKLAPKTVELDAMKRAQLEALGYVIEDNKPKRKQIPTPEAAPGAGAEE